MELDKLEDLDLNDFLKELGLSKNYNLEIKYKTGNELTFSNESEDHLLSSFSKTKIEELFISINDFTKLYSEFEELFLNENMEINIKLLNETWSVDQIVSYFNSYEDICLDKINNLFNLIEYTKDNDYNSFKERVIEAYKVFNPISSLKIETETILDILQNLVNTQEEYSNGISFYVFIENLPKKTIEDRTRALLAYNDYKKALSKDSFFNIKKDLQKVDLIKRVEAISSNIINKSIKAFVPLKVSQEDMKIQMNSLMEEFDTLDDKLEVLNTFTNKDNTFSYEKAKLAYKETSFGSTDDYLKDLKESLNKLYSVIRSIFELILLDSQKHRNDMKEIIEDNGFDLEYNSLEDIYESLVDSIELITGEFIVFCEQKDLIWTNETDIRKANNKYLKHIEKHGLKRNIQRPIYKKNLILEKIEGEV